LIGNFTYILNEVAAADVREFPLTVPLPTGEFPAMLTVLDLVTKNASNVKVPDGLPRTGLIYSPRKSFVPRFSAFALVQIIDRARPSGPVFGIASVTRFAVAPETCQDKARWQLTTSFRGPSTRMAGRLVDGKNDPKANETAFGVTLNH
jgi:hypothetical protein